MAEWISVKDMLPKSGKRVLSFTDFNKVIIGKWLSGVGCWINEKHDVIHVTHWMPLPEPPKENDYGS